jgi:hypothetical protein
MAETLAIAASVIAVIQICDRVIQLAKYYIDISADIPADLRAILVEISTVNAILKSLEYLDKGNHITHALWNQLSGPSGPIEGCRHSITELENLFPSDFVPTSTSTSKSGSSKRRKIKAATDALAWPLKVRRAKELLQRIAQYKAALTLALTTEST